MSFKVMSPLVISLIVFACTFGGALLGLFLHFRLPDNHLAPDTQDVVRLAIGLVATMVALALGLLIGSAKSFLIRKILRSLNSPQIP
jgi:hypothetical protein